MLALDSRVSILTWSLGFLCTAGLSLCENRIQSASRSTAGEQHDAKIVALKLLRQQLLIFPHYMDVYICNSQIS